MKREAILKLMMLSPKLAIIYPLQYAVCCIIWSPDQDDNFSRGFRRSFHGPFTPSNAVRAYFSCIYEGGGKFPRIFPRHSPRFRPFYSAWWILPSPNVKWVRKHCQSSPLIGQFPWGWAWNSVNLTRLHSVLPGLACDIRFSAPQLLEYAELGAYLYPDWVSN